MRRIALGGYSIACATLLVVLGWSAVLHHDRHLFGRAGATVAAISAFFVFMQVIIENSEGSDASRQRQQIAGLKREIEQQAAKSPQAALHILEAELVRLERVVQRAKMEIALVVGLFASIGEMIHGWGDLLIS